MLNIEQIRILKKANLRATQWLLVNLNIEEILYYQAVVSKISESELKEDYLDLLVFDYVNSPVEQMGN